MSEISDMIQRLCPDGVEYKKLGDFISIYTGSQFNKRDMVDDGDYPVLNGGIDFSGYTHNYNEEADTIAISQGGASAGYVNWVDRPFWAGAHCYIVKPDELFLNKRYLFHFLKNEEQIIMASKQGAGISGLNRSKIQGLQIPVPPLEVQRKIVEVLDNFSELTAELTARRKQYEYYRDNLLNFNRGGQNVSNVKWMKLGEVCRLSRGKVISKDYLRNNCGCYPVYSSQTANNGELGRINTFDYDGDYLTWTTDGAYAGTVFKREGKFSITNVCGLITINSSAINYDFLYYWLSAEAPKYVYQGMGNPKLMSNVMGTILIPVPPLAEQERIVSILDRFEALTTDLTSGLPAEIKARQQQYEYYRDRLLSFPRKPSDS